MRPLVLLRAGDVPPPIAARRGEYLGWFVAGVGDVWAHGWEEHDVRGDAPFPDPSSVSGFVLSGSSHSVTERAPWMLRFEAYLRVCVAANVPILGVCFGHQILAQALGGHVEKNPRGREIGTRVVRRLPGVEDPLLSGLGDAFTVNTTHVDTVSRLPEGARVLASTELEPHAAFALPGRARGVQFHPEIDGDAMRGWLTLRRALLEAESIDADALLESATDTPAGSAVLRNWVRELVRDA